MNSQNYIEGSWVYKISQNQTDAAMREPTESAIMDSQYATILWADSAGENERVTMIPAKLGGLNVRILGNGIQNVLPTNKTAKNYVIFPDSITAISPRSFFYTIDTAGWSIPKGITNIAKDAFANDGMVYGEKGSLAERINDERFVDIAKDKGKYISISAGNDGYIHPNGNYYLPAAVLSGEYGLTVSVVADIGYKIKKLRVDNCIIDAASDKNEYSFYYTLSSKSTKIFVVFEIDTLDSRDKPTTSCTYSPPEIDTEAVKNMLSLPYDVFEYVGVSSGNTEKYINAMGITTGKYYMFNGKTYQMVFSSQNRDTPEYYSKAEVINGVYKKHGLCYGGDYDYIRLYNYYENVTRGPVTGEMAVYGTYLYKECTSDAISDKTIIVEKNQINTAAVFAQAGTNCIIRDLVEYDYSPCVGPAEATLFYGLGSSIIVDGGDVVTASSPQIYKKDNHTYLKLVKARILGSVNSMFALATGMLELEGGDIFACNSGGHGPYAANAGQILINTANTNLVDTDGRVNRDYETIYVAKRPTYNLGGLKRDDDGKVYGVFNSHSEDVTAIVTGDEAGTALATDIRGGVIVANNVACKTYGLRAAGAYAIGANEGWVYCYNSTLCSTLDAGLCSATGGFVFAYNCDIQGVAALKTRAGGLNDVASDSGIRAKNCKLTAVFNDKDLLHSYDVASPKQWKNEYAELSTDSDQLNIFLDKANNPKFKPEALNWWFVDKSKTPGYNGGNRFAVVYIESANSPVVIDSCCLVNENYMKYGDPTQNEFPADNYLVSVEGAGVGNIEFKNQNRATRWDLTGEDICTCELQGDFFVAGWSESIGNPDRRDGNNELNVKFDNSDWCGCVVEGDSTAVINLTFINHSTWEVTKSTKASNLFIDNTSKVAVDKKYQLFIDGKPSTCECLNAGGSFRNVEFLV